MQKDLAPDMRLFKESCYQDLLIAIISEPCSSSSHLLGCIYCSQPVECPSDSSSPALTGMPELQGKEFESLDARFFLATTHLGPDGVTRLCPDYLGLEPEEISSVWSNAGMGSPPGHTQGPPCG